MIITTAGKNATRLRNKAKEVAVSIDGTFVDRESHSISSMISTYDDHVLMIGVDKISYHPKDESTPFFFHPNSSMFRVKQILRGEKDAFIEATQLKEGMKILDCTLGLASDAIVASLVAGNSGAVVGVESSRAISFVVKSGLQVWNSNSEEMNEAMRRIEVVHENHNNFLKKQDDNSFDVVYFDPMFESTISSPGIQGLKGSADYSELTEATINEAKRVASKRVVMKDNKSSTKFYDLGFSVIKRNASFLYGVIGGN